MAVENSAERGKTVVAGLADIENRVDFGIVLNCRHFDGSAAVYENDYRVKIVLCVFNEFILFVVELKGVHPLPLFAADGIGARRNNDHGRVVLVEVGPRCRLCGKVVAVCKVCDSRVGRYVFHIRPILVLSLYRGVELVVAAFEAAIDVLVGDGRARRGIATVKAGARVGSNARVTKNRYLGLVRCARSKGKSVVLIL